MKTKLWIFTFMFVVINAIFIQNVNAQDVEINEKIFPEKCLRDYASFIVDGNANGKTDGYLQQEEIDRITKIDWRNGGEGAIINNQNNKDRINCKGLEVFKNLKELHLATYASSGKGKIYNLQLLSKLPKLEKIYIDGFKWESDIDLRKFCSLKSVYLLNNKNIENILLPEKSVMKSFVMGYCRGESIDFSNQQNIRKIIIEDANFKRYKFGKLKKLTKLCINGDKNKSYNSKTKKIDLSDLNNLTKLQINNVRGLRQLTLGTHRKLKSLSVYDCKKLKKLNVSKLKKLKKVYVSKNTKVIKRKKQKVKIRHEFYSSYYLNLESTTI